MASARERAQRLVLRIRGEAMKRRGRRIPVEQCSAMGAELGVVRVPGLLDRLPRIISRQGEQAQLTEEATELSLLESRLLQHSHEPYLVYVVRKLLMLSAGEAMPVPCIQALGSCFGLHTDRGRSLGDTVLAKYPHYFHLDRGACWRHGRVRLVQWEPELAVPERDKTLSALERSGGYHFGVPVDSDALSPGFHAILGCHRYPLPSPYDSSLRRKPPVDVQLEWRRRIAVCHELLSLMLCKRVGVRALSELREELELDDYTWLLRFLRTQDHFFTLHDDTVMLKEGMDWNHVPELTPYLQARKRLLDLMMVPEHDLDQCFIEDRAARKGAC